MHSNIYIEKKIKKFPKKIKIFYIEIIVVLNKEILLKQRQ